MFAPLRLVSVVQRPGLVQVDLFHRVSYTRDFMWPHTKNRTALNPAIVEAIQWGRPGLFLSDRNIGYGVHEPHLQNGVVHHHDETRGVDGCPMTHLPIIRIILLAGRQGKCDPLGGVEECKTHTWASSQTWLFRSIRYVVQTAVWEPHTEISTECKIGWVMQPGDLSEEPVT